MCTGAEIAAVIGAVASAASTAYTIERGVNAPSAPSAPAGPSASDLLKQQQQQTKTQEQALLPSQIADWTSRVGGGVSPQFIAQSVGNVSGSSTGGLDILDDIKRSLNLA